MRPGLLLAIASALAALLAAASAPSEGGLVRVDSLRINEVPKPRVPARAAVDWCGVGQPTAANRSPEADPSSTRHVHVTYAIPADAADRFPSLASPIATDAAAMDAWWRREDPSRTIRFDLFAFSGCASKAGRLDIGFVRLPRVGSLYLGDSGADRLLFDLGELTALSDFKHLVYYDGPAVFEQNVCGTAFVPRTAPSVGGDDGIAFVWLRSACGFDIGASGLNAAVAVHELIHGLGALQGASAPNECDPPDDGHVCDSTNDVLFPSANSQTTIGGQTLDAGRDDYYGHSFSWFDVQDSPWLSRLPQQRLSVTIQGAGTRTGVVRLVSPSRFECGQSCALDLDQGVQAALVAAPRAGARFVRWLGACTGTAAGTCAITLDGARSVTAVFSIATFRLTTSVTGKGRLRTAPTGVSCPGRCSSSFRADSSVRVRATAAAGFRFVSWAGACRGKGACVVKMSANRSVRATFRRR